MIVDVKFENFKALRAATLPLGRCTLIVGPNGSGKSTALFGIGAVRSPGNHHPDRIRTAGITQSQVASVKIKWTESPEELEILSRWPVGTGEGPTTVNRKTQSDEGFRALINSLGRFRIFTLDARAIAAPVQLQQSIELGGNGESLAGVLDSLRDQEPDRFESLNDELGRWLPEFDQILFEVPNSGQRSILLRTREGAHKIPAYELSQGTLLALAILTIAYLPVPPSIVAFEEPDRGIHPRLLRDVRDALYRLAYPESCGETRPAVQVIVTTHSPYLLDLFRDHPEEIVIAHKVGHYANFTRLTEIPNYEDIIRDAHLGDLWYTGLLGGVPSDR